VPSRAQLLGSHRGVARRVGQSLSTIHLVSALMRRRAAAKPIPGLRWLLDAARRTGALSEISVAYVSPVPPSEWLLEGIESVLPHHTDAFMRVYRDGGTDIGDYDLDTGAKLTRTPPGVRRGKIDPVNA
jgi:hypothetical protein